MVIIVAEQLVARARHQTFGKHSDISSPHCRRKQDQLA